MDPLILTALIRHLLTAAAGALAVKYGIDGATIDAIVGGAAALVGVVWSIADKRRRAAG